MKNIYLDRMTAGSLARAAGAAGGLCGHCAQCGYEIAESDEAAVIAATGDIIHRACWEEYAADNADEFFDESVF